MAAIAFDTLKCARRLKEAGVPEIQAEAQAEIMAEAFVFNMDSLVTRDYLDTRLNELEIRLESRLEAKFEQRFKKIDERFLTMEVHLTAMDGKFNLIYWMLAVIIASTTMPALHSLLTG